MTNNILPQATNNNEGNTTTMNTDTIIEETEITPEDVHALRAARSKTPSISEDKIMAVAEDSADNAELIQFKGGDFMMPSQYANKPIDGARKLLEMLQALDERIDQSRSFEYAYVDVLVAFARVMRAAGSAWSKPKGFVPPSETTVNVGYNELGIMNTETVPDGEMVIPYTDDGQGSVSLNIDGTATVHFSFKRFDQNRINGYIKLIEEQLKLNSIFRGQVFNGGLQFIDVARVDPKRVVYNDETGRLLNMWAISTIRNAKVLSKAGMKTKVSVLLAGTYGTGKTEFLYLIAHMAWLHGWTTLFCRPGKDNFGEILKWARMYMRHGEGVLVIAEDIESWGTDRETMLDQWDGFASKSDNALFVVTSNFPEELDPAMLRPGRLETVIPLGEFELPTYRKLVELKVGDLLADDIDWERAYEANSGYTPAFMVGSLESVVRGTVARTGTSGQITTEDLVVAADSFRAQHDLQTAAANRVSPLPTLDAAFRESVRNGTNLDGKKMANLISVEVSKRVPPQMRAVLSETEVKLEDQDGNEYEGNLRP